MNLAPPMPRFGRGPADPEAAPERDRARDVRRSANRTPAKSPTQVLQRERHDPDYLILMLVVALTAVGILMVYSSSAMRGYVSAEADTFATVGPQIQWAVLGLIAMAAMMRVDYRYLRLASVPFVLVSLALLVLVFVPDYNIVVGGSARWLRLPGLPAIHPAEIAKLAIVIYLAHWFAKRGTKVRGLWGGTVPFLIIIAPVIALVFKEPDLGTTTVIALTALTMFFIAGANLFHLAAMGSAAFMAMIVVGLRGYQMDRIRTWLDPWSDPLGDGFHTVQGLLALGAGGVARARARPEHDRGPERLQRLHLRGDRPGVRADRGDRRHRPVRAAGLRRDPGRAGRAGHVRCAARGGHHRVAVHPGVHQHRGRGHVGADHRHHPAVHQRRRLIPHHQLRRDRDPPLDLARDHRKGDVERRCEC